MKPAAQGISATVFSAARQERGGPLDKQGGWDLGLAVERRAAQASCAVKRSGSLGIAPCCVQT